MSLNEQLVLSVTGTDVTVSSAISGLSPTRIVFRCIASEKLFEIMASPSEGWTTRDEWRNEDEYVNKPVAVLMKWNYLDEQGEIQSEKIVCAVKKGKKITFFEKLPKNQFERIS